MTIPTGQAQCFKCGATIGFADRCPNCGSPRPSLPLGMKLHGRLGVIAFVGAAVLIAVVVVVVMSNR